MKTIPLYETYMHELQSLYCKKNEGKLKLLAELLAPHAQSIAQAFYRVLLRNEKTVPFLTSAMVEERLVGSMQKWIIEIFHEYDLDEQIETIIEHQVQIGRVHARIDLPMSMVNYAARVLKNKCSEQLFQADISGQVLAESQGLMHSLVDTMVALINESYLLDTVASEQNAQSFRIQVTFQNLAFDCERQRVSLLDWTRQLFLITREKVIDRETVPSLRHSNFGLWLTHKGALMLTGRSELGVLMEFMSVTTELSEKLIESCGQDDEEKTKRLLNQINDEVSRIIWLLGKTAQEIIDVESGRDALTHLFNRRYIDTVLKHETECSLKSRMHYGILYLDIDHFKRLNDQYGHDAGDLVLQQVANVLMQSVRIGDFVFRYGGEEFLIVVTDITADQITRIAEKVRKMIADYEFKLKNETVLAVTISVGVAFHDGHPDYQRTIRRADEALYLAKDSGRNKVVVSG